MTFFLGLDFDDDEDIAGFLKSLYDTKSAFVVTPNVDHVVSYNSKKDSRYKTAIADATHIICDSRVLKGLSRVFLRKPIRNVIPGSDLTRIMLTEGHAKLGAVGLIGGGDDDVREIHKRFGCRIRYQIIPQYGFINYAEQVSQIVNEVCKWNVETVFICVGSPQQEIVASQLYSRKRDCRYVCVGASLDFMVGRERRAPKIIQSLGLEWLYRISQRPSLVRRYLYRDLAVLIIAFDYFKGRRKR